jgi:hypothetical protein
MQRLRLKYIFLIFIYLSGALGASPQEKKAFGELSYSEPANWTYTDNNSYHTYSTINNTTNSFCIISIYDKENSSGNIEQDFKRSWKGIVEGHFTVIKNPNPKLIHTSNALSYLQDEANVTNSQRGFFARLLVLDMNDHTQTILFLSGNKNMLGQYQPDIDRFIASVQLLDPLTTNSVIDNKNTTTSPLLNNNPSVTPNSGTIHFNHFVFTVPAGWKTASQGNYFLLTDPSVPSNQSMSFLLMPPLADTNFMNAGTATINEIATAMNGQVIPDVVVGHPVYIRPHNGITQKGWEYSIGTGQIKTSYPDPEHPNLLNFDQYDIGVYLARINGRTERMIYLSKYYTCGVYGSSTYINFKYEPMITDFFFNLSYDDYDTKSKQGKITNDGITGVWSGVAWVSGAWVYSNGYSTGKFDATVFILFDNGQVYFGNSFPRHGLLNLNTTAAAANNSGDWGTYTIKNGTGTMKFPWRSIPFTINGGKLEAAMNGSNVNFMRMSLPEKIRLSGTWCLDGGESCITFTADGKFNDNGVIQRLDHAPTDCNMQAPKTGQGSYEIQDHSVTFKYNTGFRIQAAFSGIGMNGNDTSPDQFYIGPFNDALKKIK